MGFAALTTAMRSRVGRASTAATVAVLVAVGLATAPPAAAEGTGGISGVVTGPGGALEGVSVTAYALVDDGEDQYWTWAGSTSTDAAGAYTVEGLEAVDHRVEFLDWSGVHSTEYYDDAASLEDATNVPVADTVVTGVDAELATPAHITGMVTDGTEGLADISVSAYEFDDAEGEWVAIAGATTQPDGTYDITLPAAGTYRVGFADWSGAHLREWWDDAASVEDADSITVDASETVPAVDAELGTPGHITGTVTDGADGLEGVTVTAHAFDEDWGSWTAYTSTFTEADGSYDLGGLVPDTYRVEFRDTTGSYLGEWWNDEDDVETADDVVVDASETEPDVDAALVASPHVTGTVTGADDEPLSGVEVAAYAYDGASESWDQVSTTHTGDDGAYDLADLTAGTYRIRFADTAGVHLTEYWNDKPTLETADGIMLAEGATVSAVDAELAVGARLSGTVTGTAEAPIEYAYVSVYRWSDAQEDWDHVADDFTDADGTYTVGGLAAGTYHLRFSESGYQEEFYDDAPTHESAAEIEVTAGEERTGLDARLHPGAHITGTVTDAADAAVEDVTVTAHQWVGGQWDAVATAWTDADGTYDLGGLRAGEYRVGFEPTGNHLPEFFDDAPSLDSATPVAVSAGGTTSGIDAELAETSHITGTVTNAQGQNLAGIEVTALQYDEVEGFWQYVSADETAANGTYDIDGLQPGSYRVRFEDTNGFDYTTEYWDGALRLRGATDVAVAPSATVGGIDAVLARPGGPVTPTGSVAGTITGVSGPLAGAYARVYAYDEEYDYWEQVRVDETDATGSYTVGNLPDGTYHVGFSASGYTTQYFDGAATVATGADVVVSAGGARTGIDAALAVLSHVTGTVTDGAQGVEDVEVVAWRDSGDGDRVDVAYAYTDAQGDYDLALPPGTYRLQFDAAGPYATEWWDDAPGWDEADEVEVPAATTVGDKDAVLAPASSIEGRVTNTSLAPLDGVLVRAYRMYEDDGYEWSSQAGLTYTDASGDYEITGLEPGRYRLEFRSGFYVPEYWDDAGQLGLADDITVGAQDAVTGKDAALVPFSSISGVVTGAGAGGLEDVRVELYTHDDHSGWEFYVESETRSGGGYAFEGIPVGSYRLRFVDPEGDYASEYYADAADLASATDVLVRSSAPVSGRDAVLAPAVARGISGTVTGPAGQPLEGVAVTLWAPDGHGDWVDRDEVETGSDGGYRFRGLAAGTYRVQFERTGFATEYHADQYSLEEATGVVVSSGDTDVDAQLARGTSLSGTVTGPAGADAVGVDVTAYRRAPSGAWEQVGRRYVGQQATYTFQDLAPGTYRLRFHDDDAEWPTEYWDDAPTLAAATDILVGATAVTGRNAVLGVGTSISGTITDSSGPTEDVEVLPYVRAGSSFVPLRDASVSTDDTGAYTITGLLPGTYRLRFDPYGNDLAREFWNDAASLGTATDIVVAGTTPVTGRNAVLGSGGRITGTVTAAGGAPVPDASVRALVYDPDQGTWVAHRYAEVDDAGRYELRGLAAGTYRVSAGRYGYRDGYHGGATEAEADDVSVPANGLVTGRDVQLVADSSLSGVVTDAAGAPLSQVEVVVFRQAGASGWQVADSARTASDGSYEVGELDAGSYRVSFEEPYGYYLPEWFDGGTTLNEATTILLAPGASRTDLDVDLTRTGSQPAVRNRVRPVISGTPAVGSPLTASPGTWSTSNGVTYSYQWRADGTPIPSATTSSYTPAAGDVGKRLTVLVTANRPGYTPGTAVSEQTEPVGDQPPVENTALPTISGPAVVGGTLTANPGTWDPSTPLTFTYDWRADGTSLGVPSSTTYTPTPADAGKRISVRVTASRSGNTPGTAESAQTAAVVQQVVTNVTRPTITGTPRVGSPLTAGNGAWDPSDGLSFAYQWSANGSPISGATTSTYTPVTADAGKTITVRVTASKPLHTPDSATSDPTAAVTLPPLVNDAPPTITGTPDVGSTLTATNGTWTPGDGLSHTYQWRVGGVTVADTDDTYVPVAADVDKTVTVTVTASRTGYASTPAASAPTAAVRLPALTNTAPPTITGDPRVGSELTASDGGWTPGDGLTFAYQWSVGGVTVADTDDTYTPVAADAGKTVVVRVTASRDGYRPTPATSAPTAAVAGPPISNTGAPTIAGSAKVGQRLTAQPGSWTPGGLTYAYQWLLNGAAVSGATTSAFVVPATAVGRRVSVRVTASGPGQAPVAATSGSTAAVTPGTLRQGRKPAISGTARVGQTLRGSAGGTTPAATTVRYQWLRNGAPIARATRSTYKLVARDKGKRITLRVTYSRTGYTALRATSRAVGPVR